MKSFSLIALCIFFCNTSFSQDQFSIPELSQEQVQQVLYNHVAAYAASGINYAKSMGKTPESYGRYVGNLFTPFWDPAIGFPGFTNQIMFILAGIHYTSEMKIVEQDKNSIKIRMNNMDLPFKQGPMLGVTYEEYMEFSYGVLVVLADFMNLEFSHALLDDGWYEINIMSK